MGEGEERKTEHKRREKRNPKTNRKTAIKFVATRRRRFFLAHSRFEEDEERTKRNLDFLFSNVCLRWEKSKPTNLSSCFVLPPNDACRVEIELALQSLKTQN